MSQDDRNNVGSEAGARSDAAGALPDDGQIHEWLDGELDAETSARFDALVQSSPAFADRVAEARGLVAAASRILTSLDSVPGGVLPTANSAGARPRGAVTATVHASLDAPSLTARSASRTRRWARWGSIAAVLMVGVTSVLVARREPATVRDLTTMAAQSETMSVPAAPVVAAPDVAATQGADSAPTEPLRARTMPAIASAAAPTAAAEMASSTTAAREALRSAMQSASVDAAKVSSTESARVVPSPDLLPSPVGRTAERVAADPALRPGLRAVVADSMRSVQGGEIVAAPALATRGVARSLSATDEARVENVAPVFTPIQSDIARGELTLAVQRVLCRPNCEQTRLEFASDGRVRRWVQTIGGGAPADTGRVTSSELQTLRALVDSLDLVSLPAMVRLDGRRCATVGSLRESMRVEFRHEGAMRSVMGLPWCSDGTHALDRVSSAAHALATQHLGAASRR